MKKTLSAIAALMIAALFTVFPVLPAAAEKSDIENVKLSPDGALTWDPYPGATRYWIIMDTGSFEPEGTSADLAAFARRIKLPSGSYSFSIVACSDSWENLSNTYHGTYEYTARIGLPAVPNMRWDGKTARWDAVEGAVGYNLYLFVRDQSRGVYYTTDLFIDFSDSTDLRLGTEYRFSVMAIAEGDNDNGPLEGFSETIIGWYEFREIDNVRLENGVLSWDPYPGATRYWLIMGNGGSYEPDGTSIDLAAAIGADGIEGKAYSYNLVACRDNWTELSLHMTGKYVFSKADLAQVETTAEVTTAEVTTAEVTTAEVTTHEVTTAEVTTAEVTTSEITTAEVSSSGATTADITSAEVSASEVTTSGASTAEASEAASGTAGSTSRRDPEETKAQSRDNDDALKRMRTFKAVFFAVTGVAAAAAAVTVITLIVARKKKK